MAIMGLSGIHPLELVFSVTFCGLGHKSGYSAGKYPEDVEGFGNCNQKGSRLVFTRMWQVST